MSRIHTKNELAAAANGVVASVSLVTYKGIVYEARSFKPGETDPPPKDTIWTPLSNDDLMLMGHQMGILFAAPSEFANFCFMIKQRAKRVKDAQPYVMVPYEDGLAYLTDAGIVPVIAEGFSPNFINHQIIFPEDEDYADVEKLFTTISDWVGGEEQAHSLLYHLATALQPGWAAVKYILLLGAGRNGKGLLLAMFRALLGSNNTSGILRQDIAARKAIIHTLNNRLANIVFDGPMSYIGDSGPEKTLTAGEPLEIELKFENQPFTVQTNALFIEALQKEPKARDKSSALQKRLVRFFFPNVYEKDLLFESQMLSARNLDAFLTLLWEHWVKSDEISSKLKMSQHSEDLQTQTEMDRSPVLAFIEDNRRKSPDGGLIEKLRSGDYRADALVDALQPWLQTQGYEERTLSGVWDMLSEHFKIERRVKRENGRPTSNRYITAILPSTDRAIQAIEGGIEEDESVVREE